MSYPTMDLENLNFEKMKKTPEDIIILQMYTINGSHMMYVSWNMESNRQKFFLILDHFLHFYPPNTPKKSKSWKKKKKPSGDIIILHMCTINDSHMMYGSWDMEWNGQNFLSFCTVFCPFTPLTTQNIVILHMCTKNYNQMMHGSWDMVHDRRMDGQRDG